MSRLPDPYEALDERFAGLEGDAYLEVHFDGCRWAEGPVYLPAGRYLLFNDIPEDRTMRWDELTGAVGVFRRPAAHANGHTLDREGRVVTCEQSGRRVTRTEHDGTVTVLADRWRGKRLNSPNDVVVDSAGAIWFTDPSYGIDSDYEGVQAESEIGACNVYRIDPVTSSCDVVADDFVRPNGLAFSADERRLFVADTRVNHLRAFDVDGPRLRNGGVLAECGAGRFDGLRLDTGGRIWAAAGDGVHCFVPGRHADRAHPTARDGLEPVLRRAATQPPVHHRDLVAVLHPPQGQRVPVSSTRPLTMERRGLDPPATMERRAPERAGYGAARI
jgi:gluconolactonase